MSGVSKEIKRRLRSIKNTRQITRAMEMVSAVKMRKSIQAVLASRQYSHTAWHVLDSILRGRGAMNRASTHGFVAERTHGQVCCVVISGNRGLAGSFNGNVADAVVGYVTSMVGAQYIVPLHSEGSVIVTLGTKARDELIARGFTITADYPKTDVVIKSSEIESLISYLFTEYQRKTFRSVVLFYTDFESALRQTVRTRVLLPLSLAEDPYLGSITPSVVSPAGAQHIMPLHEDKMDEFVFEPSQSQILNSVIPRILEAQLFQAVLESQASEHSARMFAMRNASDAASDMISELTLEYNKQRQSTITQELAEITASRMALG